jgi:hypothetical protein
MTKKLSLSQKKRIEVAKDVIALVNSGVLNPGHVGYIEFTGGNGYTDSDTTAAKMIGVWTESCDFKQVAKKCTVCALGAATLASLIKKDNVVKAAALIELADYNDRDVVDNELEDSVFSKEQMDLIESAYEGSCMGDVHCLGEDWDHASAFHEDHKNPANRLIAIMQNIIDHDGEFRPEVRYNVVKS